MPKACKKFGESMANPVLVEVTRGQIVESRHRGALCVVDGDGKIVMSVGDVERPVFPRSAIKAIQALPLVESGAAEAFGFGDRELALACSSHSGEPAHARLAGEMLGRAGLGEADLECGAHWPLGEGAARDLAATGAMPTQLHNNCSGKHAGFLCACRHLGLRLKGYVSAAHPYQERLRQVMQEMTGAVHDERNCGIDGCAIPTYAVPLPALALGFARMATGRGLASDRAVASRRLFSACMAAPFEVAGTGRADTMLMELATGRIFAKTGAEGVHIAAIPELGLGLAIKCDDGTTRGAEVILYALLARLVRNDAALSGRLAELGMPPVVTRKGVEAGRMRPTVELAV